MASNIIAIVSLSELVVRSFIGILADRLGRKKVWIAVCSTCCFFVSGFIVSLNLSGLLFIAYAPMMGFFGGVFTPLMIPLTMDLVPQEKAGSAAGLFPLITSGGMTVGMPIIGLASVIQKEPRFPVQHRPGNRFVKAVWFASQSVWFQFGSVYGTEALICTIDHTFTMIILIHTDIGVNLFPGANLALWTVNVIYGEPVDLSRIYFDDIIASIDGHGNKSIPMALCQSEAKVIEYNSRPAGVEHGELFNPDYQFDIETPTETLAGSADEHDRRVNFWMEQHAEYMAQYEEKVCGYAPSRKH
ncbi:hypothetical protein CAPTEDRAFT_211089 [Capitella teleta]|uniref:Major facilitator superfamily (MFS) profile domain-containing protein n=1 Tax=Capitella teleta TaxID=283909 RepID=R7V873_CAPTE|nr:hypothetical protein CAPTEDRAFT_211089 [Capitella teleta]|eukprot:ELU14677.1 hypothetical protein CAPTEDRAFT_211089 [Capitella teleta]